MARPTIQELLSGAQAWDAVANDNFSKIVNSPFPMVVVDGDLADVELVFPAASYEKCLAVYTTDAGTTWNLAINDGAAWTALPAPTHNHDADYAALGHNHDAAYAAIDHTHPAGNVDLSVLPADTTVGEDGVADTKLTMRSDTAGKLLRLESKGSVSSIYAGGTGINHISDGDIAFHVGGNWGQALLALYGDQSGQLTLGAGKNLGGLPYDLSIACGDETTEIVAATGVTTLVVPRKMQLNAIKASLTTASTSGTVDIDLNVGGTSVLTAALSIAQDAKVATGTGIATANLDEDAEITIDIDAAGTGAAGLKVYLIGETRR